MISVSTFFAFAGFYSAYNTSNKAVLHGNSSVDMALRNNAMPAKLGAILLLIASMAIAMAVNGIGVGALLFCILLMVSGSLIVVLMPLKILTWRISVALFALLTIAELLIVL